MERVSIGVIGGSGLYEMEDLVDRTEVALDTPFGAPSAPYIVGTLGGRRVAFLARHGLGHRLLPSELNFRANIYGFKRLGVEWIFSASAVGSLREEYAPQHVVIPDQFFDRTRGRISTFFGRGLVAHVGIQGAGQGAGKLLVGGKEAAGGLFAHAAVAVFPQAGVRRLVHPHLLPIGKLNFGKGKLRMGEHLVKVVRGSPHGRKLGQHPFFPLGQEVGAVAHRIPQVKGKLRKRRLLGQQRLHPLLAQLGQARRKPGPGRRQLGPQILHLQPPEIGRAHV